MLFLLSLSETSALNSRSYISFSVGLFDVLQEVNTSLENRIELRGAEFYWVAKPILGTMYNTDGALHIFVGCFVDIPLTSILNFSPSFAPGIFYPSKSKDLNFLIEFRSQVEIALKFDNDVKVGLSFNHISNAGLGKTNPGVKVLR